jgi:hypothetical protein
LLTVFAVAAVVGGGLAYGPLIDDYRPNRTTEPHTGPRNSHAHTTTEAR